MKHIIKISALALLSLSLAFCSSSKDEPEFTGGASFRLTTGGTLSSPTDDEFSPQLVQHPDGKLTLLFVSNRACNNGVSCTTGSLHVFMSRTLVAYTGGQLPPFTPPLTVKDEGGNSISNGPEALFMIGAAVDSNNPNNILVFLKDDSSGYLNKHTVGIADAVSTIVTPDMNYYDHEFLGIDPYNGNKIFAKDYMGIFYSNFGETLTESIPFQEGEGYAEGITSIAALPNSLSPQGENAFFYLDNGSLSMGSNNAYFGLPHLSFLLATARYMMDVRQIAVLKSNSSGNEVFLFAGKSMRNGDQSFDLYAVQGFNARQLWEMGMNEYEGFDFGDFPICDPQIDPECEGGSPPLRAFVTQATFAGNITHADTADDNCQADNNYPGLGQFKAFILGSGSFARYSVEEVLQPQTTYVTELMMPWFTTGMDSKISVILAPGSGEDFWTGMTTTQDSSSFNCEFNADGWSVGDGTADGAFGFVDATNLEDFVSGGSSACDSPKALLCVEQPFNP